MMLDDAAALKPLEFKPTCPQGNDRHVDVADTVVRCVCCGAGDIMCGRHQAQLLEIPVRLYACTQCGASGSKWWKVFRFSTLC